jgi:hypothetical protein
MLLRATLVAAAIFTAAIGSASKAHGISMDRTDAVLPLTPASFNSNEQAYLRELRHDQIPVGDDLAMVNLGHSICDMFADGHDENAVMGSIRSGAPNVDQLTAHITMDAAVTYLCPEEEQGRSGLGLPPNMQHGWG